MFRFNSLPTEQPNRVGVRLCGLATALAAGLLVFAAGDSQAANSAATVSVTQAPAEVSLSRPDLQTNLAGVTSIVSSSQNSINQVRITFTSHVLNGSGAELTSDVKFVEVIADAGALNVPTCTPDSTKTIVTCVIGQLRGVSEAPANASNFTVVFSGSALTGATLTRLHWDADFSSGASSGSPPSEGLIASGDTDYAVITATLDQQRLRFSTFVPTPQPSQYLSYHTGNGQALKDDNFAVTILVPKSGTAQVTESDSDCANLSVNGKAYACLGKQSQFVIPGQFNTLDVPKLIYDLYFDASLLTARKPGAKAKDISLFYANDGAPGVFVQIPLCTDTTTNGPTTDHPCIRVREDLKKTSTTPDAGGDVHLQLELNNNGFIRG
jgi:hypothetical protein